jgi:hypothetical protein
MTSKAEFNAEEWSTVVEGPVLAGLRVVAASKGGKIRESLAVSKVYAAAREGQGQSEFLDALVSSPPAVDAQELRDRGGDIASVSGERLREALRILRDKATPEEVEDYKGFVKQVAETAAKAHKEGGFIGIGGKEISAEEQTALDQIQEILDA